MFIRNQTRLSIKNFATMKKFWNFLMLFVIGCFLITCARKTVPSSKKKDDIFRVMFYNVENLFDTLDDPTKNDDDFLPQSPKNWTDERLSQKLNQIAKVIDFVGESHLPDLLGLCEVENRKVLEFLTHRTSLSSYGYFILHFDSPDPRGIDVALLYRKNIFKPIKHTYYPVVFQTQTNRNTRDILYAKGIIPNGEEMHVFVNHWSSRMGGEEQSEFKRIEAAKTLRRVVDSLFIKSPENHILIMGDFNDYPDNKSVKDILNASIDSSLQKERGKLYNLMGWQIGEGKGTYNYKNLWGFLDQFIVSGSLLTKKNKTYTYFNEARVLKEDFLLQKGKKNENQAKPFSTYAGNKHQGGYSDHLPIILDFYFK